jgi:hypothetical protein
MLLLAQAGGATIVHWVVLIIIIAAVVGIMFVVLQECGVVIPGFVVKIFWIVIAAILGIAAIKLILSMW